MKPTTATATAITNSRRGDGWRGGRGASGMTPSLRSPIPHRASENPRPGPRAPVGSCTRQPGVSPIARRQQLRHHRYVAFRILIVDDDASFLGVVAELLAERGFEVLDKAMDAAQAMVVALRECPDGILLDINLPGPDGFATAA